MRARGITSGRGEYGALLDALRGVTWPARRTVRAGGAGTHQSALRGLAAEFTEYRPFRQGDDARRLDWKLLARTDRAYLRLSDDHVTLTTMLLVDASSSMRWPEPATKYDRAALLAVGLAGVAHAGGDPVGVVVGGTEGRRVPPRTRRGVLGEIVRTLSGRGDGDAPLAPVVRREGAAARLVVISDFLGDADAVVGALAECVASGREAHAVHVVAREELSPADSFLAVDPREPERRRPLVDETRAAYRKRFDAWRRDVQERLRRAGATVTETVTDEPPARAVRRIVARPS